MTLIDRNFIFPDYIIQEQSQHPLLKGLYICRASIYSNKNKEVKTRPDGFLGAYIMTYCTDGYGWFESEGQRWTISPGEMVFAMEGIPHIYGPAEEESWAGYTIYFGGFEAASYLQWLGITPQRPVLPIGKPLQLIRLFNEILSFCQLGYSENFLINSAALLRQILSRLKLHQHDSTTERTGLDVEQIIQFMLEHFSDKVTVQQLAAEACLSEAYFAKQFQKKTGYAPIDYFIRLKMQKACELLSTTDLRIREIATTLGYIDPYYFSRLFKKVMGLSPRAYRKTNQFVY